MAPKRHQEKLRLRKLATPLRFGQKPIRMRRKKANKCLRKGGKRLVTKSRYRMKIPNARHPIFIWAKTCPPEEEKGKLVFAERWETARNKITI